MCMCLCSPALIAPDPDFEMHSLYQPSGLDKPDIKGKSQASETVKNVASAAGSQTSTSGGTTVHGRDGGKGKGKGYKGATQEQSGKKEIKAMLLLSGDGQQVGGGGGGGGGAGAGGSIPLVEGGSSMALEYGELATE